MKQECIQCGKKLNFNEMSSDSSKGKCAECYDKEFSSKKCPKCRGRGGLTYPCDRCGKRISI